jgi:hypothetical protein
MAGQARARIQRQFDAPSPAWPLSSWNRESYHTQSGTLAAQPAVVNGRGVQVTLMRLRWHSLPAADRLGVIFVAPMPRHVIPAQAGI